MVRIKVFGLLFAFGFVLGCGDSNSTQSSNVGDETQTEMNERSVNVTRVPAQVAENLAEQTLTGYFPENEVVLSPVDVCRRFLESLQKSDSLAAERLLTRTSAIITRKADLTLESPGSELARFEFEEPAYASSKQQIATVDCRIIDEIDGKSIITEMAWMLKRDDKSWKISGMLIPDEHGNGVQFFSFENVDDVEQIKRNLD